VTGSDGFAGLFTPRARNTPGSEGRNSGGVGAEWVGEVYVARAAYAAEVVTSTASWAPDDTSTLRGLARSAMGICSVSTPWS
jgi:hypothetical protein